MRNLDILWDTSPISIEIEDISLVELGEFDTETGYMSEAMPEHIARLIDLKEKTNAKSWYTDKVLRTADRESGKQSGQQDRTNVESSQATERRYQKLERLSSITRSLPQRAQS